MNVISDNALIGGFAAQVKPINAEFVEDVCRDFDITQTFGGAGFVVIEEEARAVADAEREPASVDRPHLSAAACRPTSGEAPAVESLVKPMFGDRQPEAPVLVFLIVRFKAERLCASHSFNFPRPTVRRLWLAVLAVAAARHDVRAAGVRADGAARRRPARPPARPRRGPRVRRSTCHAEYMIGPQDVLGINFWRDADMTGDVTVRPDGRITLPLIGDLQAAGLTPEALKTAIHTAASKLIEDPSDHRDRAADQQPQGLHHRPGRRRPARTC